jgi:propanol-preferring alcohol dehydrogenase
MRAVLFTGVGSPLEVVDRPSPGLGRQQIRLRVHACGVCRTDVHIVDGELTEPKLPLVLGHQIVGTVIERGEHAERFGLGRRVGVPWLGWTCGICSYCREGRENLCLSARFTGYTIDGGFAEETVADERFCFPVPDEYPDVEVAPLLCAGLIGYRALRLTGEPKRLGLYGFGAAAHLICQVAVQEGRQVFAFTRPGDAPGQEFARSLGAVWAGGSTAPPPEELDAAIVFASAGELVPIALGALARGGSVVCAGIHMSDIPAFPYELLWQERAIRSVANLTRRDGDEFMELASKLRVRPEVAVFPLEAAGEAVATVRSGSGRGAVVLSVESALRTSPRS